MLFSVLHPVSDTGCGAQLVKSAAVGFQKPPRDVARKKKSARNEASCWLLISKWLAFALCDFCLPASTCVSVLLLPDEVTRRARCCWQGLSLLLTVSLVLLSAWRRKGASQESTATGCHAVSRPVCLFTFVHLHFFALRESTYHFFFPPKLCTSMLFFEREPAGKNISVQLWSEWQDVPRAWCMLNSRWCTLYLPATLWALYTWLIWYRWQHFWTYLVMVALGAAPHSCIYTGIFCLCRLGWFVGSAVVPRVPPVPSAQQQKGDWRARGQHLGMDEQKINLRKVH